MDYQKLIIRHLAGETTAEEEALLQQWLQQSIDHQQEYESLKEAWSAGGQDDISLNPDQLFNRIESQISPEAPSTGYARQYMRMAAVISLILLLAGGYLVWDNYAGIADQSGWQVLTTEKGGLQQISLPDGTAVWLNTESTLSFPEQFDGNERRIMLDGEAFFDVTRDTLKPFIIELSAGSIQVLGTSFNVKAYEEGDRVETFVRSGKVAFHKPGDRPEVTFIEPNQKLFYSKNDQTLIKEETDADRSLAWMQGNLIFQETSLLEIAEELEHYFDIDIIFENPALQACTLTGTFKNNAYQDILKKLSMTNTFQYQEVGKRIVISGEGCQQMN